MSLDSSKQVLDRIIPEIRGLLPQVSSEQDARFQIVDRMLLEVLEWNRDDIQTERYVEQGRADYLLKSGERTLLVVEAKSTSIPLIDTISNRYGHYKLNGPALKSARDAIDQVRKYSVDTGARLCALTSGLTT